MIPCAGDKNSPDEIEQQLQHRGSRCYINWPSTVEAGAILTDVPAVLLVVLCVLQWGPRGLGFLSCWYQFLLSVTMSDYKVALQSFFSLRLCPTIKLLCKVIILFLAPGAYFKMHALCTPTYLSYLLTLSIWPACLAVLDLSIQSAAVSLLSDTCLRLVSF